MSSSTIATAGGAESHSPAPRAWEASLVLSLLLLFGEGCSFAACLEYFSYADRLVVAEDNSLPSPLRRLLLLAMGASGAFPCLVAAGYLLKQRSVDAVERVCRIACFASPLLLTGLLPWLFDWEVFEKHRLRFVVLAGGFGLLLERAFTASFRAWADGPLPRRLESMVRSGTALVARFPRLPHWALAALVLGTAGHFAYYTVLNHYLLLTHSWDLAIFDNLFWNLIRGEWFKASPDLGRSGSHIQFHATFIAYALAPFYALRQQADTLLVLQALVVAGGAIPLYLLGRRRLGNAWYALILAYAYCVHGPLHGPVFYDFHFLTLAPFFIGWVLYFYECERPTPLLIFFCLAAAVREDQSATLAMAALFFLMSGKRPRWALIGGILCTGLFVGIKFGLMPLHRSSADKQTFVWIFKGLLPEGEASFGSVLKTVFTNPVFTAKWLLEEDKLLYVGQALGPVLLLPLRNTKTWVLILPAAVFTLLATDYKPAYQSHFQYTSNWTSYLFFATAASLSQWQLSPQGRTRVPATLLALGVTASAFSYQFGSMFQHQTFRGGFHQVGYDWTEKNTERLADLRSLVALIPEDASVAATELLAPHVSNRENCFTLRFGVDDADYLLVRIAAAKGGKTHQHMKGALESGHYAFVKMAGDFAMWQRRDQPAAVHTDEDRTAARQLRITLK